MTRTDVTFPSHDGTCAAWLYAPAAAETPQPIIVMAHGLAGVKEMRLDAFAERFVNAGYACLVFDYRHFGESSGEPRQLLQVRAQLEDWRSAVAFARTLDGIDPERVVAWGTSFGGGHALVTAAHDKRIAAVIAQCPFTDGLASTLAVPIASSVKVTMRAVQDVVAALLGRPPVMVASYGPPGSTALMATPDSVPGLSAQLPVGQDVPKDVAARFGFDILRYFPGRQARHITCPALIVICTRDSVAPAGPTLRYAQQAPKGEITTYDVGHFDIYVGEAFERNVTDQLRFLHHTVPTP